MLQCLSLLMVSGQREQPINYEEIEDEFNDLCNAIFKDNTSIKNIRIQNCEKDHTPFQENNAWHGHISSGLVIHLIKYMKKIKHWRKLDTFQFITNKGLHKYWFDSDLSLAEETAISSNTERYIEKPGDIEEIHLLDHMKDMVENEIAITFLKVNTRCMEMSHLRVLTKFCIEKQRKYRIKMLERKRNYDEIVLIDLNIGIWNDKVHDNDIKAFECWLNDCDC